MTILSQEDARKKRVGPDDAWKLISKARVVHVAKGKKLTTWHPGKDDKAAILASVIGPTGNLRAPAIKVGDMFIVGFSADLYRQTFGA